MSRSLARPFTALLAVIALVAPACGGSDADPASELAEAITALGETSFGYTMTLDLEAAAAEEVLGPDAGMVAGLVNSVALRGVKGDGGFSFGASIMGFEPLSVRSYGSGDELYLRVGVSEVLESFGGNLEDFGLSPEALAELPGDAGELFSRLLGGEWVGFTGLDAGVSEDQEAAAAQLGVDVEEFQQLRDDLLERLSDIDQLLEDIAIVSRNELEGRVEYDVAIQTEPALREVQALLSPFSDVLGASLDGVDAEADLQDLLADAPESIPGLSATVTDGDLTEVSFDIGVLLTALDPDRDLASGDIVLRLEFSDHGSAAVPDVPADAVTYDREQLEELGSLLNDPSLLGG
ncbi:MAG TPA: hypothetical protein VGA36_12120 [Nitriliruptorales bacterium]